MIKEPRLTLFDLAICLSDACDLVSPALVNHHKQVAYLSSCIGAELGLDDDRLKDLVLAGAMHDIGALSLREKIDTLSFETENTDAHSKMGYSLLRDFKPLEHVAEIIRCHHHFWNNGNGSGTTVNEVLIESDIVHLADRVAVLIDTHKEILGQKDGICGIIAKGKGRMFRPDVCEAFEALAVREYFWLDAVSPTVYRILRQQLRLKTLVLAPVQLHELATIFSRIIDFRSRFTASHSAGVAAVAEVLAKLRGFSKRECDYIRIAGLLHDLGKLAVPQEVLEKPGKLEKNEFDLIRAHTYHTYRILDTLEDFETINTWAAFHHEKINGNGYPFHHCSDDLSLGSRIMSVADIFTAITEERPYRPGMSPKEVKTLLHLMVSNGAIDRDIVELLERNIDTVIDARFKARKDTEELYKAITPCRND